MDPVDRFFHPQNSSRVNATAQVQLALSLIATAWEPNMTGAVAVLGILASILDNNELLQLYFVFTPASIIIDLIQILFLPSNRFWHVVWCHVLKCRSQGSRNLVCIPDEQVNSN